jgi:hypothetical protein
LHRVGLTLEDRLDAAVAKVAYPAVDTREARSLPRGVPEEDALDAAVYQHPTSASTR